MPQVTDEDFEQTRRIAEESLVEPDTAESKTRELVVTIDARARRPHLEMSPSLAWLWV